MNTISTICFLLIAGLVFLVIWSSKIEKRKQDEAKYIEATKAKSRFKDFILSLQRNRILPELNTSINLHQKEFVCMMSESEIYEFKNPGQKLYVGTKVNIAGIPIYLGGSQAVKDQLTMVSKGDIYMTNKRIIFIGSVRSWECKHSEVIHINNNIDLITVNCSNSQKPITFCVKNGFFWEGLNKLFTQTNVETARIPDGVCVA